MSTSNIIYAVDVDAHCEKNLIRPNSALTHAYSNSTANGIPEIALSPSQGKFLSLLTTMSGSRNVLELGTLGAYSTIWIAQTLRANGGGKITSIEVDPARRDVALTNLEYAGVTVPEEAEVVLGAGLDVLPKLEREIEAGQRDRYDFVFIDADWGNQGNYFDWGLKLSKGKGSVIYVDNVVRQMMESGILGAEKRDQAATDLVESVGKDERVDAVVMQTVGAKDYDGFLMAVVK
ncbi:MAG: hypothetical protein LQ338_006528 [Usnochroma carphineum]|nr:MAG: hypothetical protein LQ338_006528 [Usnochroma carphineum]